MGTGRVQRVHSAGAPAAVCSLAVAFEVFGGELLRACTLLDRLSDRIYVDDSGAHGQQFDYQSGGSRYCTFSLPSVFSEEFEPTKGPYDDMRYSDDNKLSVLATVARKTD